MGVISIDQFKEVEIKVGLVVEATNAENSEKLIRLVVDCGEEQKRIIFTGVRPFGFVPDYFVGKKWLIVTNLEPRKMVNDEYSQGMMLAVDGPEGKPVFVQMNEEIAIGSKVR